jgi:hypothetical protein
MAETIVETILPGVYIEVRAEGLLSVGAIATGNVGVLGTAAMGDTAFQNLSSFDDARVRFGDIESWDRSAGDGNLTLARLLKMAFDNGARTVYARRVLDEDSAKRAEYTILDEAKGPLMTLQARTPGAAGNRLMIRIEPADADEARQPVADEVVARHNGSYALSAGRTASPNGSDVVGRVTVHEHGLSTRYQLRAAAASGTSVQVDPDSGELTFATQPSAAAEVAANYLVPVDFLRRVTLRHGNAQEVYVVPSIAYLRQLLAAPDSPSRLVEVKSAVAGGLPKATVTFESFAGGENGKTAPDELSAQYQAALDELVEQPVQLVLVGAPFSRVKAAILGHVEKTENLGRERIAILGADGDDTERVLENANEVADKRVVLVAPGLSEPDAGGGAPAHLPPYVTAAAVAGRLASQGPHISLTNKAVAGADALAREYNYGELKALVQSRVLPLERKRGIRVVKGISTDDGAFRQISIRRIVDYAKEGTRQGAGQYIGRLNDRRVRENLRTTLDSFLADMLQREYLTGYKLSVTADRAMEIRGEVLVEMDLNPTFSIDVIRVHMNLS